MYVSYIFFILVFIGIPGLVVLTNLSLRIGKFLGREKVHPYLAINSFPINAPSFRPSDVLIKLAHTGTGSMVITEIRWSSHLYFLNERDRIFSWFLLLRGYFTNDIEGLRTMLGPRLVLPKSTPLYRALNLLIGILYLILLLTWLYTPIGWLAILLASPTFSVELRASDEQIELIDTKTNTTATRPYLIFPGQESTYVLTHGLSVNGICFPANYQVDHVNKISQKPICKLPRSRQFIRRAEDKLLIRTDGRWLIYPVTPGVRFVRLSPPPTC